MNKHKYPNLHTDREWIVRQLNKSESKTFTSKIGDHDLNPGTRSTGPYIPAAVLIPLILHVNETTVLLTRRTENLTSHPGQISFPGGQMENTDGTPEETALRETEEEIGLHRSSVDIIGRLSDYETRTGYRVTPFVGLVDPPIYLKKNLNEVAEFFEVPLSFLLDPINHQRHSQIQEGAKRNFYAIPYKQYYIWGATAGILVNFYEVLKS